MWNKNYNTTLGKYGKDYKQKSDCPACSYKRCFVPYVDVNSRQIVDSYQYGKCDREDNCGYHWRPPPNIGEDVVNQVNCTPHVPKKETSTIFWAVVKPTQRGWENNNLIKYWTRNNLFDVNTIEKTLNKYIVGTTANTFGGGASMFWQVDANNDVRSGKVIQYCPNSGKRMKNKITWAHTLFSIENYNLEQCLFGEHLINKSNKIGIVESEKTALIMDMVDDSYTWVASCGLNGINERTKEVLKDKDVTLFYDIGAENKWKAKSYDYDFFLADVRHIMESNNYDYKEGDDIADMTLYLRGE